MSTKNIFLILGYGIPKDIMKDENYNFYLKTVFNIVYDISLKVGQTKSLFIFSGGNTDILKPYRRNESDEMLKYFSSLIKQRRFLNNLTKNWQLVPERKSISTLENLVDGEKIIRQRTIKKANIFIFCEKTREKRIRITAKKIFSKNYKVIITPVDFDVSSNRYLSPEFLAKKEKAELELSLLAIQSEKNLKKHHELHFEKIKRFRKLGSKADSEAIRRWWEEKLEKYK